MNGLRQGPIGFPSHDARKRLQELDAESRRSQHRTLTGQGGPSGKERGFDVMAAIGQLQAQLSNIMTRLDNLEGRVTAIEKENAIWHKSFGQKRRELRQ